MTLFLRLTGLMFAALHCVCGDDGLVAKTCQFPLTQQIAFKSLNTEFIASFHHSNSNEEFYVVISSENNHNDRSYRSKILQTNGLNMAMLQNGFDMQNSDVSYVVDLADDVEVDQTLAISFTGTYFGSVVTEKMLFVSAQLSLEEKYEILKTKNKILSQELESVKKNMMPSGSIVMWQDCEPANIPQGWKLCDGSHGTPDTKGKFVIGQDNASFKVGDIGGSITKSKQIDGKVTIDDHLLTVEQLPKFDTLSGPANNIREGHRSNLRTAGEHKTIGGNKAIKHEVKFQANLPPYLVLCYIKKM